MDDKIEIDIEESKNDLLDHKKLLDMRPKTKSLAVDHKNAFGSFKDTKSKLSGSNSGNMLDFVSDNQMSEKLLNS